MNYPLISEYVDAIRSAEDNFDKLSDLRPVLDGNGNPVMSSGNFAVVFKMQNINTGKLYAVKCFTKEQKGRKEAYRQIADELEFVQSTYLAKVKYYDRELFVDAKSSDDSEFPVLLMDWVEGVTFDKYIRQNINDTYALKMLAYNFSRLAMWLLPQPFAHGDLKPDNILVHDDGSLTLVDYDGMFVPAMEGQKTRELGSPDFRHPMRTEDDFNEHIDDFPIISILLSLRLIAADPILLDKYGAPDRLLFSEIDYRDLPPCVLLKYVFPSPDAEINTLVGLFTIALSCKTLTNVSFHLLSVVKPEKPEIIKIEEELSTEVTDEDLANAIEDELGAKYSKDWKRLLKGPIDVKEYKIKDECKIICDRAFQFYRYLQKIDIPSRIISIGDWAFDNCKYLREIILPKSLRKIGKNPFSGCNIKIMCNSPQFKLVDNVLYDTKMDTLISYLSTKTTFAIPSSVLYIGDYAFNECNFLKEIIIPPSVIIIGESAFSNCLSLTKIHFPKNLISIEKFAFSDCESLQEIIFPQNIVNICNYAFSNCHALRSITIQSITTNIAKNAFLGCSWIKFFIPKGSRKHFESLLPNNKNILVEVDNI